MNSLVQRGLRLSVNAALLGFGVAAVLSAPAEAGDPVAAAPCPPAAPAPKAKPAKHHKDGPAYGTLGYGPPGLHAGFQGFGLGYHLGYGYGGEALGVGADGGYPYYGGPGYPHSAPPLRRLGPIVPFAYSGGPGYATPGHPNFFGGVGPLVGDQPVIQIESEPGEADDANGYGAFSGTLPYPESAFAPFTTAAGASGPSGGVSTSRPAPNPSNAPAATGVLPPTSSRSLGVDTEPDVDANGVRGLRVTRVDPGGAAGKAGLGAGDVIRSANGYLTEQPGNVTWILNEAAPDGVVTLSVRVANERDVRTVTARLR